MDFCQGCTSIIVAQRLSTIWNADSIAVIQDGAIIEHGTHKELIAITHGVYSNLVECARNSSKGSEETIIGDIAGTS